MSENVIIVKNADELYAALQNATGGDRIELAPGEYGDISLNNINYASEVVITSQNESDLAEFNTVMLLNVSNITFDNLFFDFTPDEETVEWSSALRADNSSNITVINSRFEGGPSVAGVPIDSEPGTQGAQGIEGIPIGRAMTFNWSENITIENNDISQFSSGVRFSEVDNVTLNSNEIYDFRQVPVGGADVSNLYMEDNYFHDANPWEFGGLGDHGDFVHFWTRSADSALLENYYISGNIFDQGDGVALLGIYLEDNYNVGYSNVIIENNLIYNGNAQAIRMENVNGLYIRENTLLQSSGTESDAPEIRLVSGNENVVIENNIFAGVNGPDLEAADAQNITIGNNLIVQIHDPHAENYYGELFINSASSVFDIQGVPGDMADGIGARLTQFNWLPDTLTPQFQVRSDASSEQILVFDASLSVGALGLLSENDATFTWTFGDGSTATGQIVKHEFASAGYHDVMLTVTAKDGTTAEAHFTAGIAGDDIVQFDAQSGLFEALAFGEETALDSGAMPLLTTADGFALRLGGEGTQASVAASELSRFFGTDEFEMSMTLKAGSAAGWGEIARIHTSFTASVDQDGNFSLDLFFDDGSRMNMKSQGISLLDGALHDVTVRFDGEAGFAEILIDGQVVASENVSGSLGGGPRSLDFGNPWGSQNFEGELSGFALSAESLDFPIYDGAADLPADTPTEDTTTDTPTEDTTTDAPTEDTTTPTDPEPLPEEDSGALEPLLHGGYELDFVSGSITVYDDAHITETLSGPALSFDGKKDYASLGRLTEFEASQKIAFSIDFTSTSTRGGAEKLVWNDQKIGLTLEGDGVRVHVGNTDYQFNTGFLVDGLGLNDGNTHTATVMVDAETDRLQVVVDDVLVLDEQGTDFDFVGAGGHEWGWSLGTPRNQWFEGEVSEFQVSDDFTFIDPVTEDGAILV